MRQARGLLHRRAAAIALDLIQQRAGYGAGKRLGCRISDRGAGQMNLHADLAGEDAIDNVHAGDDVGQRVDAIQGRQLRIGHHRYFQTPQAGSLGRSHARLQITDHRVQRVGAGAAHVDGVTVKDHAGQLGVREFVDHRRVRLQRGRLHTVRLQTAGLIHHVDRSAVRINALVAAVAAGQPGPRALQARQAALKDLDARAVSVRQQLAVGFEQKIELPCTSGKLQSRARGAAAHSHLRRFEATGCIEVQNAHLRCPSAGRGDQQNGDSGEPPGFRTSIARQQLHSAPKQCATTRLRLIGAAIRWLRGYDLTGTGSANYFSVLQPR